MLVCQSKCSLCSMLSGKTKLLHRRNLSVSLLFQPYKTVCLGSFFGWMGFSFVVNIFVQHQPALFKNRDEHTLVSQPKLYPSVLLPEIIIPSVPAASPESRPTRILLPESFHVGISDYRLHLRHPNSGTLSWPSSMVLAEYSNQSSDVKAKISTFC